MWQVLQIVMRDGRDMNMGRVHCGYFVYWDCNAKEVKLSEIQVQFVGSDIGYIYIEFVMGTKNKKRFVNFNQNDTRK